VIKVILALLLLTDIGLRLATLTIPATPPPSLPPPDPGSFTITEQLDWQKEYDDEHDPLDICPDYDSACWLHILHSISDPQTVIWIWDSRCLTTVTKNEKTWMEAPAKPDGSPDMRQSRVYGVSVHYDPSCGRIEIRHSPH